MTTELNPSPAPEPQGAVQAQFQNGAPQNQQGQHSQGQGQGGHRRRRRRRNKGKSQQNAGAQQQSGAPQNQQSAPAPAAHYQGQQKQKSGKRFFQKNPGNQGNFNGNGFRAAPGNGNGNGGGGGRRKNKGRRQQVFVGPMDHSYRSVNGNVADPASHQQSSNEFRGMPHSGFYSETDYYQPVPMREDAPTRIYCFIEDLFLLAKIQEVSKKLGIKVAFVKPEKEEKDKEVLAKLTETNEEDRPALILFDLNNANAKPLTLIPKIRTKLKRSASIIGFLSHVQGDLKNKAIEAGCDTVMPRSTFSQNLPSLLRRYGSIEEESGDEFQAIQA